MSASFNLNNSQPKLQSQVIAILIVLCLLVANSTFAMGTIMISNSGNHDAAKHLTPDNMMADHKLPAEESGMPCCDPTLVIVCPILAACNALVERFDFQVQPVDLRIWPRNGQLAMMRTILVPKPPPKFA